MAKLTEEEVTQLVKESTRLLNLLHKEWGGCEIACATSEPVLHRLWAERYLDDNLHELEEGRKYLPSMPNLDKRIGDFLGWLEKEPCTHPGNEGMTEKINGCMIISNTARMCAPCRLRMAFFHTVYNAEAYYDCTNCDHACYAHIMSGPNEGCIECDCKSYGQTERTWLDGQGNQEEGS